MKHPFSYLINIKLRQTHLAWIKRYLSGCALSVTDCRCHYISRASYQIRKTADCACAGNSLRGQLQRKPLVSDTGMQHGTWVTHVPWSMSRSQTRDGRGKRSRHSRRMRTPQFYASGKRPMKPVAEITWHISYLMICAAYGFHFLLNDNFMLHWWIFINLRKFWGFFRCRCFQCIHQQCLYSYVGLMPLIPLVSMGFQLILTK